MRATAAIGVGNQGSRKNSNSHIDASHSRQPLVKGERLVRYEVNAVMPVHGMAHDVSHDRDTTHSWLSIFRTTLYISVDDGFDVAKPLNP